MPKIQNDKRKMKVKEYVKKYREKINANENLKSIYRKRHAESCKKYRIKMKQKMLSSTDLLELKRKQERERKRKYRAKKDVQKLDKKEKSAYKTPQTMGKDLKKIKNVLPEHKEKKIEIMRRVLKTIDKNLTISFNIGQNNPEFFESVTTNNKYNQLNTETIRKVEIFFCREDISRVSPNVKDKIKIKSENGTAHAQKRHMMYTVSEAFSIFKEENPGEKIKISKFYELRPKFVMLISDMPHDVCVCKYHANIFYLIDILHKNVKFPKTHRELLQEIVCSLEGEDCMMGICQNCKDIDLKYSVLPLKYDESLELIFKQWATINGRVEIISLEKSIEMIISTLENQLPFFKKHIFIKNSQQKYFDLKRSTVGEKEIILQMDFAENFSITAQDEIQSAHWSHSQVTIYTAVAWGPNNILSFALVSNYLSHDRYAVNVFLKKIIEFLKLKVLNFEELCVFSDGCAAQFKNRYTMSSLCFLPAEMNLRAMEWNFFASSHGKGAVDGIGATVKRKVFIKIAYNY